MPGYSAQANAHPATCLFACLLARLLCPGYSAQATAHPASCLPVCYLDRLLCPGYCTPCHLPACLFAGQATLPRLLHTLPPACLHVCLPGYSAKATAHPADCLLACPFACEATLPSKPCRLTACLPACWPGCSAQATLPRLLHTLPPACLPVCLPGYSAKATAHPATCLPVCLLDRLLCPGYCTPCHLPACMFACQATLSRLLHTLPTACLPARLPARLTLPSKPCRLTTCLPAGWAVLPRLLCPDYCTPCHLPVRCPGYSAQATEHPASCLPVCWPGYSAKANAHPATCLLCLLDRLLCPGYCTPCHLPSCLFACQATLPRLLHTLPTACLPVCWPGYSAQQTVPPDCLPACLLARLFSAGYSAQATAHPAACLPACLLARLLCPGYCTPCHLPAFLPVSCPCYSAKATEHPASCLPVSLLDRLFFQGYCTPSHLPSCLFGGKGYSAQQTLPPHCLPACVLARLICPGYSTQATAHPATCLPACLPARLLCPGY